MRPKLAASLIVVGIAALPACSEASKVTTSTTSNVQAAPQPRITMKPSAGDSRTRFVVTFTAPLRTIKAGGNVRYVVSARTTVQHGCVSSAFASVSAPRNGARVSAKLAPLGGFWCAGTYHGKVIEAFQPVCAPGKFCPALIIVPRTIGTFTFRVKAGPGAPAPSTGSIAVPGPTPCVPLTSVANATCG
jgi:hypothetical protein